MNFIEEYFIEESLCDDLLNYYDVDPNKHRGHMSVLNDSGRWEMVENPSIKSCTELLLYSQNPVKPLENYLNALQKCVNEYIERYPWCNKGSPWGVLEPVNIQHYDPGEGYYKYHAERTNARRPFGDRHLVFMTYLNTVTDDGGTEFLHQDLTVNAEVGKTLIWPADWTHTHRGIPSQTQEKIIITGWFSYFPDW